MPKATLLAPPEPEIIELASVTMATVTTVGDPTAELPKVMNALYGSVYTLKFALKKQGREFKVGALRARWPNAQLAPRSEWIAYWGIPVPADTTALPVKVPGTELKLEVWTYGTVAQVLHLGPYSTEGPTVRRLHEFIEQQGYAIAGLHEEEYLTRPDVKNQKTLVRYPVRPVKP
ncbi:MAG TPA: GyrI-like domain-containing protein [Symbiobacteriaceae bacterium]|jgi:hypothetical protein